MLKIFVRVNSGGTTLSYSDLLLSMATNQWQELDVREEVRSLVSEINSNAGRQFSFSKDVVLKTALTNADVDVRFKVTNFTQGNMAKVEAAWPQIKGSLLRAASLLQQFGYIERNLTANSVIISVAHYLHLRGAGDSYLDSTADAVDRLVLQRWVTRSLVKRGIFAAVEEAMAAVGKSLALDNAEIDELLNLKYAGQRTFYVLSVLYPGLDLSKKFHEDHIFPQVPVHQEEAPRRRSPARQHRRLPGCRESPAEPPIACWDCQHREAGWPACGVDRHRLPYREQASDLPCPENGIDGLPLDLADFTLFFEQRKQRIRTRLLAALGTTPGAPEDATLS